MFEDEDIKKAAQLHELGYHKDTELFKLAKLIYAKRIINQEEAKEHANMRR